MLILNPSQIEIKQADNFMSKYKSGGFGKNVLEVSDDEFFHFIRIGKLCEIIFVNHLVGLGASLNATSMLVPCSAKHRVGADFILKSGQEVDIKAGNKPFHTRILVREDQFKAHIHDIYIGAKWVNDNNIEFHGYCFGSELALTYPTDFGYGKCRHKKLNLLKPIDSFIKQAVAGKTIV